MNYQQQEVIKMEKYSSLIGHSYTNLLVWTKSEGNGMLETRVDVSIEKFTIVTEPVGCFINDPRYTNCTGLHFYNWPVYLHR